MKKPQAHKNFEIYSYTKLALTIRLKKGSNFAIELLKVKGESATHDGVVLI